MFLLIFVRMTGFFVIAPLFGRRNVPYYIKIGFSLSMALIIYYSAGDFNIEYGDMLYNYVLKVMFEFLTGLTLGFVSYAMFTSIYVAGQLIDMQIGFGAVNVIDPLSSIQISLTSNFYFILSMVAFFSFKGHHMLIKALFDSYKYIPAGGGSLGYGDNIASNGIEIIGNIFIMGFKIAAPITAAILIADIVLGVISRTVPQFNVFVVGMPLKIALGLIVAVITIPMLMELIKTLFYDMDKEMLNLMKGMAGR